MVSACASALALAAVFVQCITMVTITVWALAVTRVVVQDLWAGAIGWWAPTPASLRVNDQIPMTLYVMWTLTAT